MFARRLCLWTLSEWRCSPARVSFPSKWSSTRGRFFSTERGGNGAGANEKGTEKNADTDVNTKANTATAMNTETKIAELQDSYLRCLAEMENVRQRTRREVESASVFAIQKFCRDVIGVADVLELALGAVQGDPRTEALLRGKINEEAEAESAREVSDSAGVNAETARTETDLSAAELEQRLRDLATGLSMTLRELLSVFARHGVTPIDPLHQRFDPNFHMAMYEVPRTDIEPGTVVAVQKKGYVLNQRVVRPAAVGVSRKDSL
jgi:molecular chaperone GrpE